MTKRHCMHCVFGVRLKEPLVGKCILTEDILMYIYILTEDFVFFLKPLTRESYFAEIYTFYTDLHN